MNELPSSSVGIKSVSLVMMITLMAGVSNTVRILIWHTGLNKSFLYRVSMPWALCTTFHPSSDFSKSPMCANSSLSISISLTNEVADSHREKGSESARRSAMSARSAANASHALLCCPRK